jgi:DHA1 family bicyclomycin/chloramphenicol resistance-like MFS transporter
MDDWSRDGVSIVARGGAASPYLIVFFGALIALGPLSMDAYLPAMPAMADAFGVSIVRLNNTISTYLLGYGVANFVGGAFSDQIGRKRVGLIGLSLYVLAAGSIAFAGTVAQVQWLRVLQAIGGGFSTVICMAAIRDIYPVEQLGRRFAMLTLIMLLAPLFAPALGAFLLRFGWHAIFVAKASYAAVLLTCYVLWVPETHTGNWGRLSVRSIFVQSAEVVTRRVNGRLSPLRYMVSMAMAVSVLMIFLTNASFLYIDYFGVTATMFPLVFACSVVGLMMVNLYSMKRLDRTNAAAFFRRGLRIQLGAVSLLFVTVLTDFDSLWTVVPLIVVTISSLGLVNPAGSSCYMGFFHRLAGSASALYTTTMFCCGALLGACTGLLFDGTPLPMSAVMLVTSATANAVAFGLPNGPAGAAGRARAPRSPSA